MERKDYELQISEVKNEILQEIKDILGNRNRHDFREKFYVHYIEGDFATTEIFRAVEITEIGMVTFVTFSELSGIEGKTEGEVVFHFDPWSFIDILDNLKRELREEKLSHLRDIIKRNGGRVIFDGSFGFNSLVADNHVAGEKSMITCIELDDTDENRVYLDCKMSDVTTITEKEENIPFDQLDSLIAYVESQTKKKFTFRVSGSFSRCFDIEAATYEEAERLAKEEWRSNPLCYADSNGEDWDGYQYDEK